MTTHAILSPSSAYRWLACQPSVKAVEAAGLDTESSSAYAEEGTIAHTVAEATAALRFGLKPPQVPPLSKITDEMVDHGKAYADLLEELLPTGGRVLLEQRVYPGVPECSGTADAILIGQDSIRVVDYKFGRGVGVTAKDNPQLMLYGLGAVEMFDGVVEPELVEMSIYQPRVAEKWSTWAMPVAELRDWRETTVLPAAEAALAGLGIFRPSEKACRFCPLSGQCRIQLEAVAAADFGEPALMDADELGEALGRAKELKQYLAALEKVALERAQIGTVTGWKLIKSGGKRVIADHAHAIQTLIDEGFSAGQVSRVELKPFRDLDRLTKDLGGLSAVLGDQVTKTEGTLSLVPEDDKRQAVGGDFADPVDELLS